MIYQVLDKLIARGAVLTQSFGELVRYAPDPPELLLERMQGDFAERVAGVKASLAQAAAAPFGPGQAWNIAGRHNILARAREMIDHERSRSEPAIWGNAPGTDTAPAASHPASPKELRE